MMGATWAIGYPRWENRPDTAAPDLINPTRFDQRTLFAMQDHRGVTHSGVFFLLSFFGGEAISLQKTRAPDSRRKIRRIRQDTNRTSPIFFGAAISVERIPNLHVQAKASISAQRAAGVKASGAGVGKVSADTRPAITCQIRRRNAFHWALCAALDRTGLSLADFFQSDIAFGNQLRCTGPLRTPRLVRTIQDNPSPPLPPLARPARTPNGIADRCAAVTAPQEVERTAAGRGKC